MKKLNMSVTTLRYTQSKNKGATMNNQNNNNAKIATIGRKVESEKIDHLLDKFFEIPAYQRLYEWEKEQIETLLDDMKRACDLDKEKAYFIGNITTSKKSENEGEKFILIDGQQRLTTLWFIGFYLASREYKWEKEITKRVWQEFILKGDKLRIAMPIRDKEREALESLAKKIQKHNKEEKLEISKDLQGIHKKIIDAFGCIESWFNENFSKDDNKKEIDFERLNCFAIFIYTKVCFVFVKLAQNTDLNRFFVRMNNRGKQLEKHEILKARILSVIQQGGGEWQKYAKIWDLCSDMNKYIFQSASDRKIFEKENKDNDTPDKVESIIDFPTFLLHCYKLWIAKKCNENKIPKEITITKDKLLEIMWDAKEDKDKHNYLFIKSDKQDCKDFIVDMLRYRVLFDYFVIKNTLSDDGFAIMRLYENKGTYQAKSKVFTQLTMIQNYLRVARQGDRQNYHHWLTPFLKFLSESRFLECKNKNNQGGQNQKRVRFFQSKAKSLIKNLQVDSDSNGTESKSVEFLENLDSKLAIAQSNGTSENSNSLIDIANEAIQKSQNLEFAKVAENINWDFLNNGTGTPHYWFYRLEYYLWKWGTLDNEVFETQWKEKFGDKFDDLKTIFNAKLGTQYDFKSIAKNFYFRNLNSVEHIQPQSRAEEKDWQIHDESTKDEKRNIDCFGNLALLSVGFNSSLSNQDNADKRLDLQKKINKSEVESLKLWLVYALYIKEGNEWTYENAQEHQNQMLDILIKSLKSSQ